MESEYAPQKVMLSKGNKKKERKKKERKENEVTASCAKRMPLKCLYWNVGRSSHVM